MTTEIVRRPPPKARVRDAQPGWGTPPHMLTYGDARRAVSRAADVALWGTRCFAVVGFAVAAVIDPDPAIAMAILLTALTAVGLTAAAVLLVVIRGLEDATYRRR